MSRFIFSMQGLLDIKEKLEDQEKNNFRQANMRLMEAEEELAALRERKLLAEEKLRQQVTEVLHIQEIRHRENAVDILKMYVEQQRLVVKQREKEVEVARNRLNEAIKERKVFEKLREKAYEEYKTEENLKEQKEIDEMVSYRYGIQTGS